MPKLSKAELAALVFTLLYMVAWLAASLVLRNGEFLYYFAIMCVLVIAVGGLHLRVRFHVLALWGLTVWGLLHMAGGLMPVPETWPTGEDPKVLYNLWLIPGLLKYDQLIHAYGFGLVTWIAWQGVERVFASHGVKVAPNLGLLVLCVATGMGFGAANEIVEFIATQVLPGTNVGGYVNTGWDLIANLVGCLIAATLVYVWRR
jgi:hypothetical protein